jgi:hypothetical protein
MQRIVTGTHPGAPTQQRASTDTQHLPVVVTAWLTLAIALPVHGFWREFLPGDGAGEAWITRAT